MRKIILLLGGILIGMISGCGNSESQWVITNNGNLEYLTLAYNTFLSKEYSTNRIYIVKVGGNNCVPVNESKVDEFVDDVWKNGDQERILIQGKLEGEMERRCG